MSSRGWVLVPTWSRATGDPSGARAQSLVWDSADGARVGVLVGWVVDDEQREQLNLTVNDQF